MQSLNSLLIIASAMSVFVQYTDANQCKSLDSLKEKIRSFDLKESDHNSGVGQVKIMSDEFRARTCLRITRFLRRLFYYLIGIVIVVSVFYAIKAVFPADDVFYSRLSDIITAIFGVILIWIAYGISQRTKEMKKDKREYKDKAREINIIYNSARATLDSENKAKQVESLSPESKIKEMFEQLIAQSQGRRKDDK